MDHWALSNTLVEVLVAFGEIVNSTTIENVEAYVRTVISHYDDLNHCHMANGIVSLLFEEEAIVGPYWDAVDRLTRQERIRLFTMAIRGSDLSELWLTDSWAVERLAELIPTGDAALDNAARAAFAAFLNGPPEDAIMPNEAAAACLAAIRGWSKFESALPPEPADLTAAQRNWRLVADLVLTYERDSSVTDTEETWQTLLSEPRETILTLASFEAADSMGRDTMGRLVEDYPEPLRKLFEWALDNPAELPTERILRLMTPGSNFVIRMLGSVGNQSTAARLHVHTLDPQAGRAAVDAIRQINRRLAL